MSTVKTKIVELPTFEQLTESEKAKVIENYRDINIDSNWYRFYISDFLSNIAAKNKKYFTITNERFIYFSGFSSQGDGLCFDDAEIDYIEFIKDNKTLLPNFFSQIEDHENNPDKWKLEINIKKNSYGNHYCHARTRYIEVETNCEWMPECEWELLEIGLTNAYREYCDEFYKFLNEVYDDLIKDSAIKETLIANDYTFNRETLKIDS